jgi:hypothetical protein
MTVIALLVVLAFVLTVIASVGRCPLFVPVLLLCLVELLRILPLR